MSNEQAHQNVMSNPPAQFGSSFDGFTNTFGDLTQSWKDFGATGYLDPLKLHMQLAWNVSQTGSVDFTALAKASVSMIGLIPGAGPVVPFINMFVGFIFPKIFGAANVSNNQAYFDLIMRQVETLVDQKFRSNTVTNLNNYLDGIQGVLSVFQDSVQAAVGRGSNPDISILLDQPSAPTKYDLSKVYDSYKNADAIIIADLPHFKNPETSNNPEFDRGTVLITLPMYTIVATLHLVLKQGYIQFASRWLSVYADDERLAQERELNSLRSGLQQLIKKYTGDVSDAYSKYLPELNPANKDSVNTYNRYVRSMQLGCFDVVSAWPALDDSYYFNASTDLDKTRLVFSDIAGPWEGNSNIAANIVDVFTPINGGIGFKEASDLRKFTYVNMELSSAIFNSCSQKIKGVEHSYCTGLTLKYDKKVIRAGIPDAEHTVQAPMTYINICSQNSQYLDLSLLQVNGINVAGGAPWNSGVISLNSALPNQKINAIYPVQSNDKPESHADTYRKWGFMSSHVPYDLSPENHIGDVDKQNPGVSIIKGFPLQKGTLRNGTMVCVSEPINSASVVDLAPDQEIVLTITNETTQHYNFSIRYACAEDVKCAFSLDLPRGNPFPSSVTLARTKDLDGNKMFVNGECGSYRLCSLPISAASIPGGGPALSFSVRNIGSQNIFLDRIEIASGPAALLRDEKTV